MQPAYKNSPKNVGDTISVSAVIDMLGKIACDVPVELRVVVGRLLHLVVPAVHGALGEGRAEEEAAVVGGVVRRQLSHLLVLSLAWSAQKWKMRGLCLSVITKLYLFCLNL